MKKANSILNKALENIKPSKEELSEIESSLKSFIKQLKNKIKSSNIKAEVFVGGSYAKRTIIKKDVYDVDIFLRFDKKYNEKISEITEKLLKNFKKTKIHGSRDYFRIDIRKNTFLEIIPVIKIKSSKEAKNITDLSFFHVNYIKKKASKKILDEIMIAKAFCHAQNCYGAESYINGFSGYGLELLIYHYKSFLNFIKNMAKAKQNEKVVIDTEKKFKNKQEILMDLNSSKLQSPIILIDPTCKERNTLAALSNETFREFQNSCKKFIRNPNLSFFEKKEVDFNKLKENAKKRKQDFILIKAKTNKQEGDIAGSKLLKFHNHLTKQISKYFQIKNKGFVYNNKKSADYFFIATNKKEIVHKGPKINDKKNLQKFKRKHKKTFTKKGRIYAREKINFTLKDFLRKWVNKNKKRMKEMSIKNIELSISYSN